jgi:hypothetical protein
MTDAQQRHGTGFEIQTGKRGDVLSEQGTETVMCGSSLRHPVKRRAAISSISWLTDT